MFSLQSIFTTARPPLSSCFTIGPSRDSFSIRSLTSCEGNKGHRGWSAWSEAESWGTGTKQQGGRCYGGLRPGLKSEQRRAASTSPVPPPANVSPVRSRVRCSLGSGPHGPFPTRERCHQGTAVHGPRADARTHSRPHSATRAICVTQPHEKFRSDLHPETRHAQNRNWRKVVTPHLKSEKTDEAETFSGRNLDESVGSGGPRPGCTPRPRVCGRHPEHWCLRAPTSNTGPSTAEDARCPAPIHTE